MEAIFTVVDRVSYPFLRVSLGVVLLWIGALHLFDPSPVVGLLTASLPFLAFGAFVYVLGAVEVAFAIALFANIAAKYVGLGLVGLFAGTLLIFVVAPGVSYEGARFPVLSLAGEFLLKDLVLMAASIAVASLARQREAARQLAPVPSTAEPRAIRTA